MREIRTSGSEGGGAGNLTGSPYPYNNLGPSARKRHDDAGAESRLRLDAQAVEPGPSLPSAACAAARRAIGTRNGEHDT